MGWWWLWISWTCCTANMMIIEWFRCNYNRKKLTREWIQWMMCIANNKMRYFFWNLLEIGWIYKPTKLKTNTLNNETIYIAYKLFFLPIFSLFIDLKIQLLERYLRIVKLENMFQCTSLNIHCA
jgi:hypothetical protein